MLDACAEAAYLVRHLLGQSCDVGAITSEAGVFTRKSAFVDERRGQPYVGNVCR